MGLFAVFAMSNIPACEAFFLFTYTKEQVILKNIIAQDNEIQPLTSQIKE